MKIKLFIIILIWVGFLTTGQAQIDPVPSPSSKIQFTYDAAGNRIIRQRIFLNDVMKTSGGTADSAYNEISAQDDDKEPEETKESFEESLSGAQVRIYPNPVEEKLNIEISHLPESSESVIFVYDVAGKQLYKKENLQQTGELDFSKYANGSYILRIVIGGEQKEWVVVK